MDSSKSSLGRMDWFRLIPIVRICILMVIFLRQLVVRGKVCDFVIVNKQSLRRFEAFARVASYRLIHFTYVV